MIGISLTKIKWGFPWNHRRRHNSVQEATSCVPPLVHASCSLQCTGRMQAFMTRHVTNDLNTEDACIPHVTTRATGSWSSMEQIQPCKLQTITCCSASTCTFQHAVKAAYERMITFPHRRGIAKFAAVNKISLRITTYRSRGRRLRSGTCQCN